MKFSFTRTHYTNTRFQDIDLYFNNCVKYDICEDNDLVGTLIVNEWKAFAKFQEQKTYLSQKNWPQSAYYLHDEHGSTFVSIKIVRPFFKRHFVELQFAADSVPYQLVNENVAWQMGPFNIVIQIWNHTEAVFSLQDHEHRTRHAIDTTRPMAGTLYMADELYRDKIFGFLYASQVYIWSLHSD